MTINAIKKALRSKFGYRKYRISNNGEIHVYEKMPHTNEERWYLYGYVGDVDTMSRIKCCERKY